MSAAPRVLVVDDEPSLVRVLVWMLEREGFVARGAHNGVDALAKLSAETFDLVLCDVKMPVMDGPTLLRTMRQRGDETRVVFLSGYADLSDAHLRSLGASAVYNKPLDPPALIEVVRAWSAPRA